MLVFKRGLFSLIKSILIALVAPVILYFIILIFTDNVGILYGVSGIAFIFLIVSAIFSENIKFEIEGEQFRYYLRNKIKTDINLKDYSCGYHSRTTDGSADDLTLYLVNLKTNEESNIDCTALGIRKFHKMYAEIERLSVKENKKLETKKRLDTKKKGEN